MGNLSKFKFKVQNEELKNLLPFSPDSDMLLQLYDEKILEIIFKLQKCFFIDAGHKRSKTYWKNAGEFVLRQAKLESVVHGRKLTFNRLKNLTMLANVLSMYYEVKNFKVRETNHMLSSFLCENLDDMKRIELVFKIGKEIIGIF